MKKKISILYLSFLFFTLIILLVSAPSCRKTSTKEEVIEICKAACQEALRQGLNLSSGPCLLDPIAKSDWVCDIAHQPREAVDNLRENQCNSWHNGTAKHFIELTPECEFIKAI